MIKFTDAALLAFTKLRTNKIRTIITIVLASLLFGMLVAASLAINGVFRSVGSFREDGLTSRYIVNVYPSPGVDTISNLRRDPHLITEAKKRYEKLVEAKKVEAKRLGLSYTQASDQPPYTQSSDGNEMLTLRDQNGIVHDLLEEYFKDKPAINDSKLKKVAQQYHADNIFSSTIRQVSRGSTLNVLPSGKEAFYDQLDNTERDANYVRPIIADYLTIAPPDITDPFMLPDNAGWKPDGTSLPIILPQNAVERLLSKDMTSDKADVSKKLADLKHLRSEAADLTVQACYRNDASIALIQKTILQQKDIKANVGKKDYQKPNLIYKLPDPTKCKNPSVVSDTRTADEKKHDDNQKLFDKKLGSDNKPESYFVTFKVVGISPAEADSNPFNSEEKSNDLSDIVNNLLKTSGIGQAIPQSLYGKLSNETKEKYADLFTFNPTYFFGNEDEKQRYVEFSNPHDAQNFIDEQGCKTQVDGACKPASRDYELSLAFTNSAALDDVQDKAQKWFGYGMLVVVVLAAIIMWIAIGRAIADGRHETAVFRAIGFNRGDIAAIYVTYTVILSILVTFIAAIIGYLGAFVLNQQLAPALTAQAQYGFAGIDMTKEFSLIGFDERQLLIILAVCFTTGLVSMIIPLLNNVRRSPIKDMREE